MKSALKNSTVSVLNLNLMGTTRLGFMRDGISTALAVWEGFGTDMKTPLDIYAASDYAGAIIGKTAFYFGYEETLCKKHGPNAYCECDEPEWCFVAKENKKEVARYTQSTLEKFADKTSSTDNMMAYLLVGILKYQYDHPRSR